VVASSAAGAAGLVAAFVLDPFDGVRAVVALLAAVLVAGAVYVAVMFVLRRDDVLSLTRRWQARKRRDT
jgi:uncharacterized protein (DUF2062 family)